METVKLKLNPIGVMEFANGDRYEGGWLNNEKNGRGTYKYSNGNKYEGEFKDNMKHGKGSCSIIQ